MAKNPPINLNRVAPTNPTVVYRDWNRKRRSSDGTRAAHDIRGGQDGSGTMRGAVARYCVPLSSFQMNSNVPLSIARKKNAW